MTMKKVKPPIRPKQGKVTEPEIEDVKVDNDTSLNEENNNKEPEMTHEQFRDSMNPEPIIENIEDETLKKNIKSTEFVDVDAKNSGVDEDSNVKVNFMSNNYMEDLISKKTEEGKGKEDTSKPKDKAEQPGVKQTNDILPNSSTGNDFSKDDFGDFAEVFMDIIDMGISTALRFWGKDTSTTAYELQADKKRRIVRQLTNLFMKYQAKFSLEFMLIITLIICYSVPFQKAQERRKLISAGIDPEPRGKGKPTK